MTDAAFAQFLRSRRERTTPDDVGLAGGPRRRTPGLRREEIAGLAGVSVDYYVRLEQGRDVRPSRAVLEALARALRLDPAERSHLFHLAHQTAPVVPTTRAAERIRPGTRRLVDALAPIPAVVVGRTMDVLTWNEPFALLVTDYGALPVERRNTVWFAFMEPAARLLFVEWERAAKEAVSHLRAASGQLPDDARLAQLVGELSVKSPEFGRFWASNDVKEKGSGRKELLHPVVGRVSIDYEVLRLADDTDQRLVTYLPADEASSQALHALVGAEGATTLRRSLRLVGES